MNSLIERIKHFYICHEEFQLQTHSVLKHAVFDSRNFSVKKGRVPVKFVTLAMTTAFLKRT